ncbi:unnamed protein product [Staurois parvus]|uniref:Uncharacterized protein n=1 Tax=Staurois parvus TaxID=386267 RepID=A0ABN9DBE0_9NEOB|nr:unnamed protein product [Staurois parvus]
MAAVPGYSTAGALGGSHRRERGRQAQLPGVAAQRRTVLQGGRG